MAQSQLNPAIAVTQQLTNIVLQFEKGEECFYLCTFLPFRSRFQNQDCGVEREEDQTPDLVSRRWIAGSFLLKHAAVNV